MKKKKRAEKPKSDVDLNGSLSPKMLMFCNEFIVDLNGAQAAIRAGYSKKTARTIANQLLTKLDIRAEVQRLMNERADRTQITADKVLAEIARLAFSNIGDYVKFDDGHVLIKKESGEFSREELACISEVSKHVTVKRHGGKDVIVKFKLHDKKACLEMLGHHLKLFEGNMGKQAVDINVNITKDA